MQYFITFLEGLVSFISPCMLPMLPVYISYIAGDAAKSGRALIRSLSFVLGFTVVFSIMGVFSGSIGVLLRSHQTAVQIISGCIVVLFGLSYLGVIKSPFAGTVEQRGDINSAAAAFVFGIIYSVSLTPCIGVFLGSALMMAATSGSMLKGMLLLICYSLGLGLPFVLSSLLIETLSGAFASIKKNYAVINKVAGGFLIAVGIAMATGMLTRLLMVFS